MAYSGTVMADMKVSKTQTTAKVSGPKAAKRAQASDTDAFARHLDRVAGAAVAPPAGDTAGISAVSGILAAQELPAESDSDSRRQLARRGEDILARLDEIRLDILSGGIPKSRLENLAKLLRARRQSVDDPHLIEIIKDIELRAEVEIAKFTRRL